MWIPGRGGQGTFSAPKRLEQLWGRHSLIFNGYCGSFPGTKRPGREINHSFLSDVEVKNEWSYTSVAPGPYAFMAWTGNILVFKVCGI